MKEDLLRALTAHAHGEMTYHKANVNVYLNNPVGIGEHPDLVSAVDSEISKLAEAEEKLLQIETLFGEYLSQ